MSDKRTIFRVCKDKNNPYVMLNKQFLNDTTLSWKAKGILAYLLSLPDDWQIFEDEIVKHSADGKDSLRSGIKELIEKGYIERERIRDEKGRLQGCQYKVYEVPKNEETKIGKTYFGKSKIGETEIGKSNIGKPATTNNELTNNDRTNNDCTNNDGTNNERINNENDNDNGAKRTLSPEIKQMKETTKETTYGNEKEISFLAVAEKPHSLNYEVNSTITAVIGYYLYKYKEKLGKEHPRLKANQYQKVVKALSEFHQENYLTEDHWFAMIDRHFERSMTTDYNINHFATKGVLTNIMYESAY